MKLLRSKKNEIHDLITKYGFSPKDFDIKHFESNIIHFEYIGSEYYFEYRQLSPKSVIILSPSKNAYKKTLRSSLFGLDDAIVYMNDWLGFLEKEVAQRDKWEEYYKLSESLNISGENWDEQYFTSEEKVIVKEKLCLLKEVISKLDLLEEQVENLNENIDYLSRKVEDTTKLDWKNIVVGTLFNKFFELAIGSETAKQIWNMVTQLFSNIPLLK